MALTTKQHNKEVLRSLKPGDRLEAPRRFYSHFGIFTGKGKVVHRTGDGHGILDALVSESVFSPCGVGSSKAVVRQDSFWKFAGDTPVFINNCSNCLSAVETVANARGHIGDVGYNVFSNNCEHFSTLCQTGTGSSSQVENLVVGLAVAAGVTAVGAGIYWYAKTERERMKEEERIRKEEEKQRQSHET